MGERKRMQHRYRRFSFLSDIHGIKSSIGEMKGLGHPKQPPLNKNYVSREDDPVLDEEWFVDTIQEDLVNHPDNIMEYPFYGERIFEKPLVGFVRGDDPLLAEYKRIIGPFRIISPGQERYEIVLSMVANSERPTAIGRMLRPPSR